jgi:hypothetical protein
MWVSTFYNNMGSATSQPMEINSVKDVKIPNWEDSFNNILKDDNQDIVSVIMKYKSYTTGIDNYVFNNWVSWGKYNMPADH